MGGATVRQWGQLAPTEIRLWGQNYVEKSRGAAPDPVRYPITQKQVKPQK